MLTDPDERRRVWAHRYRLSRIARQLAFGPVRIHPPSSVDEFGWLKADLRLMWIPARGGYQESMAVYVDDTINRDANFLLPVIRHVIWHAEVDRAAMPKPQAWPALELQLGRFERAHDEVDAVIRLMQERLRSNRFAVSGLVCNRAAPDLELDRTAGHLQIDVRNGVQEMRYESPALLNDGGFTRDVVHAVDRLKRLLEPIPTDGWRESYECNPLIDEGFDGPHWYWDYQPARSLAES